MQSTLYPYMISNEEVVLNFWAFSDEFGNVQRISGKAYVLDGKDPDKLDILRLLSKTDFLSAKWFPVPKNFNLTNSDGETLKGVVQATQLNEPYIRGILFNEVMNSIENELPEQLRISDTGYERFTMKLPESPLCITTIVIEQSDGTLVPMISS